MIAKTFLDFLHERIGQNWVIARRTQNIVARYGSDVVTLSPQRYTALAAEYEQLTGRDSSTNEPMPKALQHTIRELLNSPVWDRATRRERRIWDKARKILFALD